MWGIRVRTQVFKRESHTQIHLNWVIVEFLFCIKKKKKKENLKFWRVIKIMDILSSNIYILWYLVFKKNTMGVWKFLDISIPTIYRILESLKEKF